MHSNRSAIFAVILSLALAAALIRIFLPFWSPILWAAVLAVFLRPVQSFLVRHLHRRSLAALTTTGIVIFVIGIPALALLSAVATQAERLYRLAAAFIPSGAPAQGQGDSRAIVLTQLAARLPSWMSISAQQLEQWMGEVLKRAAAIAGTVASSAAVGLLGTLAAFAIMVFTLFFFLRDGEEIWRGIVAGLPFDSERTRSFTERIDEVLHAVLLGTLLTALLQGLLGGIGFAIFGLPAPAIFGAMMFFLSLLPVGGTALVWAPAALILGLGGHWGKAAGLAAWGALIVGMADNWFKPMIISGRSRMNTLPIFFGVTGGLLAFGLLGVFLGPLCVCLGMAVWEDFVAANRARALRGTDSIDYHPAP